MIILKFIFFVLAVIFLLGLIGGLVMVVAMYRLRKNMEKAFKNAQQDGQENDSGRSRPDNGGHAHLEGEVEMVKCPHCGTFTNASDPVCEHCGREI